jgi:nucleoid DNA-binding protein
MPDYLSKSDIAQELSAAGFGNKTQISRMLDGLAELAVDELSNGEDFLIPGIVKISWAYQPPKKKGERWKKGEEVNSFGNIVVKETDSPPIKAAVALKASLRGQVGKLRVKKEEASDFLKTSAGKNVKARKG